MYFHVFPILQACYQESAQRERTVAGEDTTERRNNETELNATQWHKVKWTKGYKRMNERASERGVRERVQEISKSVTKSVNKSVRKWKGVLCMPACANRIWVDLETLCMRLLESWWLLLSRSRSSRHLPFRGSHFLPTYRAEVQQEVSKSWRRSKASLLFGFLGHIF